MRCRRYSLSAVSSVPGQDNGDFRIGFKKKKKSFLIIGGFFFTIKPLYNFEYVIRMKFRFIKRFEEDFSIHVSSSFINIR